MEQEKKEQQGEGGKGMKSIIEGIEDLRNDLVSEIASAKVLVQIGQRLGMEYTTDLKDNPALYTLFTDWDQLLFVARIHLEGTEKSFEDMDRLLLKANAMIKGRK